MGDYELAILGDVSSAERASLEGALAGMLAPFGLGLNNEVLLLDSKSVGSRNRRVAFSAAYFRGAHHADASIAADLVASSALVIPVIANGGSYENDVPACLRSANGYRLDDVKDPGLTRLASALLEGMKLLQRQRRVFVSYRRVESRAAAIQLHDELSANGFDVFLDTHDVQIGEQFQEMLWHRLCDSDVMVMLDTPTYFTSKWTRLELGRARATGINVLQVVWPDHNRNAQTDLAETIYLDNGELEGADGPLIQATAMQIVHAVENLRSRSVAARQMAIVGKLRAEAEAVGAKMGAIGAHRAIPIVLPSGKRLFAYPVVGVPTADLLNDVANKAQSAGQGTEALLVYDHIGLRPAWIDHLKWLDDQIDIVKAIRVREASWALTGY